MKRNRKEYFREYRLRNKANKRTFLLRQHSIMRRRVAGKVPHSAWIYEGLPICSKEEFLEWGLTCPELDDMLETWKDSGYEQRLRPTIDRINGRNGYVLTNMEWATYSDNVIRANKERAR